MKGLVIQSTLLLEEIEMLRDDLEYNLRYKNVFQDISLVAIRVIRECQKFISSENEDSCGKKNSNNGIDYYVSHDALTTDCANDNKNANDDSTTDDNDITAIDDSNSNDITKKTSTDKSNLLLQIKSEIFKCFKMLRVMCMNMINKVENYFTDYNVDIVMVEIQSVLIYINNLFIINENKIQLSTKNNQSRQEINLQRHYRCRKYTRISSKEAYDYNTLLSDKNGNLISRFFWQKYFNCDRVVTWITFSAAFEREYGAQQVS